MAGDHHAADSAVDVVETFDVVGVADIVASVGLVSSHVAKVQSVGLLAM